MAEVFLAVVVGPEGFRRTVVIKRMLPQLLEDRAFVRMFIDEAKLCALLSHPNLVQIFEFGKVGESFFIAMEHVHGHTLSAVQTKLTKAGSRAPVATSLEIVRQVCLGLDYAHGLQSATGQPLGIVHRDISPTNLMLAFQGGVKILDFGIARVAEELRETRTQVGTMKGKASYMSPEQARLEPVDNRSDIFAVGIVLHELLTGRRLFRGTSEHSGGRLVLEAAVPEPSSVNPEVTPAIDRVVMRALERNPDARYQTAGEMASDIEELLLAMRAPPHGPERLLESLFPYEPTHSGEFQLTVPLSPRPLGDVGSGPSRSSSMRSGVGGTPPPPPLTAAGPAVELGELAALVQAAWAAARGRGKWIIVGAVALAAIAAAVIVFHAPPSSVPTPPATVATVRAPRPAAAPAIVAPEPTLVRVSLDSTPQDAQVTRQDSGEVVGRTPTTIALPRESVAITFRFEKSGHQPTDYKIIPDLDKAVRVDLAAARSPAPKRAVPPRRAAPARAVPAVSPTHRRAAAAAEVAHGPLQSNDCTLSVGSYPWAELWIDGRDTGQHTPVMHYAVTCGAHKLVLWRRDLKLDRTATVILSPGQELKQHYELEGDYVE
jgi:serine/threonine protein kinase